MFEVLFVCMGNICRSPAAEAVFRRYVEQRGLTDTIACESAGLLDYHAGEKPDRRMIRAAKKRGYRLTSRARQIHPDDFERFGIIVALDEPVMTELKSMASNPEHLEKIALMGEFHPDADVINVPDPYYEEIWVFEQVLDLIEVACRGLTRELTGGGRRA